VVGVILLRRLDLWRMLCSRRMFRIGKDAVVCNCRQNLYHAVIHHILLIVQQDYNLKIIKINNFKNKINLQT